MGSFGSSKETFDVLILGAGLSGLSTLHNVRTRFPDWRVKVIEAAPSVGGTWFWNCYPGARFDSESISYQLFFDKDVLNEWNWKETYAAQPDTLEYIKFLAKRKDLEKDVQFNTRIKSAQWQDQSRTWLFTDEQGRSYVTRFFVSCIGILSSPTLPNIEGIESFAGQSLHTSQWPSDFDLKRDLAGKRIGVIGTGATGIQTITAIGQEPSIKSLHVFQRTPSWSAPLRNEKIGPEKMEEYRARYDQVYKQCSETPGGFLYKADPRKTLDVTEAERLELWEKLYAEPGFGKWLGTFSDSYTNREANELYSAFMEKKIRARVTDPEVADTLIPKTYGFGLRRLPLESGYFEVYNQPHVTLVDLQKSQIAKATSKGLVMSDGTEHELDVLIFATGFSAVTGAWADIEWYGKDGRPLMGYSGTPSEKSAIWIDHRPKTFLGITAPSMPNAFMVLGPHQPVGNAPRSIENASALVCDLLQFCKENGYTYAEPTEEAVEEWTSHVFECSKGQLSNEIDSWMTGVNKNAKGRSERTVIRYAGHSVEYRRRCKTVKEAGWKGMRFA